MRAHPGRVDAFLERAEPGLDAEDRRQVVRLLGRVRCEHAGAGGCRARHRRARVGEHLAARARDGAGVAVAVGHRAESARRHHPEFRALVQLLPLEQMRDQSDLVERGVRAAQQDEVDLVALALRVERVVDPASLGGAVADRLGDRSPAECRLERRRLGRDAGDVEDLDPARRRGRRPEVLQIGEVGLGERSDDRRPRLLHQLAHVVAEHPPLLERVDARVGLQQVGRVSVLGDVVAPVGDLSGERGGTGRGTTLAVGAGAEHRVGVDDGRGLHPGDVLAANRKVADLVGRAGREDVDAALGVIGLRIGLQLDRLRRVRRQSLGVIREPVLQLARRHLHARDLDVVVTVEVDHGVGLRPPALAHQLRLRGRRLCHRARDVPGVDEALRPERLAVPDQQIHRGSDRGAVGAVAHPDLFVGELHRSSSRPRRGHHRAQWPRRGPDVTLRSCWMRRGSRGAG